MSFLYPAFLVGAAAIALPIVLHLLRRDVAPEVPFTAVRLLRRSPIERSRRRRLRDLLLLAARIAALLLLAGSFARPYLAKADATTRLQIVAVDRSFSMAAPEKLRRAADMARAAVDTGGPSRVAVIAFDDHADVIARPGTPAEARAAISTIQPGFGATRYGAAIARAIEVADGDAARLVIVSDMQRSGWEDEPPLPVPADFHIEVRDVGATNTNLAVADVRVKPDTIVASIRNSGSAARNGEVRAVVDGHKLAASAFSVGAGASADVAINCRVPSAGSLAVVVDDPDGFAADNVRYVTLGSVPRRRVLIVTGDNGAASGFYMSRALEASAPNSEGFEPVIVPASAAAAMSLEELSRHAAVVLLSTHGWGRRARDTLGAFTRNGGGLIVIASSEVDAAVVSAVLDWRPPLEAIEQGAASLALAATDLRHPIFRPFGALAANLGQVRFERAWRIRQPGWDVVARFTDGTPALLERAHGNGRIVLFASDVDRRWNQFPLHPAFVPFAIETVRYVASGKTVTSNYTVANAPLGVPQRPGVYRLADGRSIAVNVDARESVLSRLTADEFARMIDRVPSAASTRAATKVQLVEARQSYWRYGLALMLFALVAESFVGQVQGPR